MFVARPIALTPFARERIVVTNEVKQLTASVYNNDTVLAADDRFKARTAFVCVEGPDAEFIRVTLEGTDPVAGSLGDANAKGHTFTNGDAFWLDTYQAMVNFKALRNAATNMALEVTYYR